MPVLTRPEDEEREQVVAAMLELAWGCEVHSLGKFSPYDFYITKDGQPKAVAELKCRDIESTEYDTTFLSVRKYIDLMRAANAMRCNALFVVQFTDGLFYYKVTDNLDGIRCQINGRKDRGQKNDVEPHLLVPVARLKRIGRVEDNGGASND